MGIEDAGFLEQLPEPKLNKDELHARYEAAVVVYEEKQRILEKALTTQYSAYRDTVYRVMRIAPLYTRTHKEKPEVDMPPELRAMLLDWGDSAVKDDANLYVGLNIWENLGEIERIRERIKLSVRRLKGDVSVNLTRIILEHGDESQAEEAMREWIQDRNDLPEYFEEGKYFREKLATIDEAYQVFLAQHGFHRYNIKGLSTLGAFTGKLEWLNAACELKKKNYDVAIGVLKRGVHMASLMDYIGQQTRYVEWHKHWKRGPVWKSVGNEEKEISQAQKILVCENDSQSGKTIGALAPFLERLLPNTVDIFFFVDFHNVNEHNVKQSGYYDDMFELTKMPADNLIENIKWLTAYSADYLKKQEEK